MNPRKRKTRESRGGRQPSHAQVESNPETFLKTIASGRVFAVLGIVGVIAMAVWATSKGKWPRGNDQQAAVGSKVERPASFDKLDAAVAQLIDEQLNRVNERPEDPSRHARLGLIYEANELWDEAFTAFSTALELKPDEATWRYHYAMNAHEIGEFEIEQRELARLAKESPKFTVVWQRLGQLRLEAGDLEGAEAAFEHVRNQAPGRAAGWAGMADVRLRQNQIDSAIGLARRAVQIEPENKVANFLLGRALVRRGEESRAERYLRFGVGGSVKYLNDPMSAEKETLAVTLKAQTSRGMKALVAGNAKQAAQLLEQVLRNDPANVTVMNNLAGAYVQLGKTSEAYKLLQIAKASEDQKASTYVNLANYWAMKRDYDRALRNAELAVQLDARSELTHRARASVLFFQGRYADALESAHQATVLNPGNTAGLRQAADLADRTQQYGRAADYYESLTRLEPDELAHWVGLAKAAVRANDLPLARSAVAGAQQIAPNEPVVRKLAQVINP